MRYREAVTMVRVGVKRAVKMHDPALAEFITFYCNEKLKKAAFHHTISLEGESKERRQAAQRRKISELMDAYDVISHALRHRSQKGGGG